LQAAGNSTLLSRRLVLQTSAAFVDRQLANLGFCQLLLLPRQVIVPAESTLTSQAIRVKLSPPA
jgi:hypothetical protein